MSVPKIYLDNCCYNRPFDDSLLEKVRDEATAKMFIQSLVKYNSLELHSSFMLLHEINDNPNTVNKDYILSFVTEYASVYVSREHMEEVINIAEEIKQTGIKEKDATHLACSMISECEYFITTDKRLLKYKNPRINIVNPIDFVRIWRETI